MNRNIFKEARAREKFEQEQLLKERTLYYERKTVEQLRMLIAGALSGVEHKAALNAYIGKLDEAAEEAEKD